MTAQHVAAGGVLGRVGKKHRSPSGTTPFSNSLFRAALAIALYFASAAEVCDLSGGSGFLFCLRTRALRLRSGQALKARSTRIHLPRNRSSICSWPRRVQHAAICRIFARRPYHTHAWPVHLRVVYPLWCTDNEESVVVSLLRPRPVRGPESSLTIKRSAYIYGGQSPRLCSTGAKEDKTDNQDNHAYHIDW